MNKKMYISILLIMMYILSISCTLNIKEEVTNINNEIVQVTKVTINPTENQLEYTKTPIGTSTQQNNQNIYQKNNCVEIREILNPNVNGAILLTVFDSHETKIKNFTTNIDINIGVIKTNIAISPDHLKVAYISYKAPILYVIDGNKEVILSVSIPNDWEGVIDWVDEENLLIAALSENGEYNTILYNLRTGDQLIIESTFPNYQNYDVHWENYMDTKAIFSPDMSSVIYPQYGKSGYIGYLVYDIANDKIVFDQKRIPEWSAPIWSDDGSFFIAGVYPKFIDSDGDLVFDNHIDDLPYIGGFDLFKISKNGNILDRLTTFSTSGYAYEEKPVLSNDQNKLAFWLKSNEYSQNESEIRELVILDLKTKEIQFSCLTVNGSDPGPLYWSPHDEYLLVNYSSSKVDQGIILLDLLNWEAQQLDWKNQMALAWLEIDD